MNIRNSLRLLQVEMVLTATLMSVPIMVPFYNSIGMDQGAIGLSQALFTIALLACNIPTGWLADRFSRKFCNVVGDVGCGVALLLYSQVTDFTQVVMVEILFGVAMAFTQGADDGLFKYYTQSLDPSGASHVRTLATVRMWQPLAQMAALLIGGSIGAIDMRLVIALSAVPYCVGALLSLLLQDSDERLVQQHRNVLGDMVRVTRQVVVHNARLRWLVIAYAVGRESTHVTVWALTPLLLLAGVPLAMVALGWALNMMANVIGARMAGIWSHALSEWQRFLLPIIGVIGALSVMSIHLSLATIWLYAFLGIAQGWSSVVLMPMLQRHAPMDVQSTLSSIAKSAAQLLYIPLVWIINVIGVIDIRLIMIATIVVFVPLAAVTAWRLYSFEHV